MDFPEDPGLISVLSQFGLAPESLLGHGGEAWVYAIDEERVLRVIHEGGRAEPIRRRQALVDELARARPRFALPELIEIGENAGRVFAIERRLHGRSVLEELRVCNGAARSRVIEAHLDAAAALGDLHLGPRAGYGDLIHDNGITTPTWREYLERRATMSLARSVPELTMIDATSIADQLPEPELPAFVHLDAWIGNMLTDGQTITAVIDIGPTSIAGDRRFDPVSAVVYLASPEISGPMSTGDVDVAMSWLRTAGLEDWFEPARRWLGAYWSFATDDPAVMAWCRRVLLR